LKAHRILPTAQQRPRPISCGDHDYIEIACLYRYTLKITLRSGEIVHANAITTVTKKNHFGFSAEYLVAESNTTRFEIPLNDIIEIETDSKIAKFQRIILERND